MLCDGIIFRFLLFNSLKCPEMQKCCPEPAKLLIISQEKAWKDLFYFKFVAPCAFPLVHIYHISNILHNRYNIFAL